MMKPTLRFRNVLLTIPPFRFLLLSLNLGVRFGSACSGNQRYRSEKTAFTLSNPGGILRVHREFLRQPVRLRLTVKRDRRPTRVSIEESSSWIRAYGRLPMHQRCFSPRTKMHPSETAGVVCTGSFSSLTARTRYSALFSKTVHFPVSSNE